MRLLQMIAIAATVGLVALGGRYLLTHGGGETAPAIGGPFTLVDGTGKTVTEQDFRGRYTLVYFGYTFCPDVCPTSLSTTAQALGLLPAATADKIVPVFISVDPDRDTPEMIGQYVAHFHPRMVGLTGSSEQVKAAAKAYKVFYQKVEEDNGDPEAYLMDHSAVTYLMGPDGTFLTHFSHGVAAQEMADTLARFVQ
jgi:protein SCO1/2